MVITFQTVTGVAASRQSAAIPTFLSKECRALLGHRYKL
jgi:hypothetical protein